MGQEERAHVSAEITMPGLEPHPAKAHPPAEGAVLCASTVVATLTVTDVGEVVDANDKMCVLLGVDRPEKLQGRVLNGDLLADSAGWRDWQRAQVEGVSQAVSQKLRKPDGGTLELAGDIHIFCAGSDGVACVMGVFVEVGQERRLRRAATQGARMEALACLTSGIAHDVNNLLTVLVGNLYLVGEEVRSQPRLFKKVKAARDAAKRGSELTRRLLSFARRESVEADVIDPGKVLESLAPLLRRALGRRVTLETRVEATAGAVTVCTAELESAVVNLAINARDAIESQGSVVIGVANAQLDGRLARSYGVKPGEYVKLWITDDGAGIEPETLERIFEPFFSTKKNRGGTGLGMSMVRWFAEQAGGAVNVISHVGKGTTVAVFLPRTADHLAETSSRTTPLSTLPSGVEHVLVLAADDALRATMHQMLETLGYTPRLSRTAADMFDRLHTESVDLVIIDALSDGGVGLATLLRRARALKPDVKAIVAAAYGESSSGGGGCRASYLSKPFSLFDFANVVRRTLDGAEDV